MKERTVVMLLKDHEYVMRRMDQYYQENIIATKEDINNLKNNNDNKKDLINDEPYYVVDPNGFTRKLIPGGNDSIFLESENNDKDFTPRSHNSSQSGSTENIVEDQRASYLNLLASRTKNNKKPSSLPHNDIPLAPEGDYEENCHYLNEPKIVPRDKQIKVVFPGEEKDKYEDELPDFLQNYIRNKRNAVKGDYMKDYKKYQTTLQEEIQTHPTGVNLYEGAKTFLSDPQIKNIEQLQQDSSLIPNQANLEKAKERVKPKIKIKLPDNLQQSVNPNNLNSTNNSIKTRNDKENKLVNNKNELNKQDDTFKKKIDIERVIENAQICKNNFSLLYTDQDKEFGKKLEKWKKYKYIQGQGKERGKLLRYSIWRKDIFVQENQNENNGMDQEKLNPVVRDLQLKKNLLKNKDISEKEKEAIKERQVSSLMKWEEERRKDLEEKLRKESQTLQSYLNQVNGHADPINSLNHQNLISNEISSSIGTIIPLKKEKSSSKSILNQNSYSYSNSILNINDSSNKLNSMGNAAFDSDGNINIAYKKRNDTSKINTLMRKTKQENKVQYLRDYSVQKNKIRKEDEQLSKDIFVDNKSVMDQISNFSVDRFIHEYKAYMKRKESIWNREGNNHYNKNDENSNIRSYNGISINIKTYENRDNPSFYSNNTSSLSPITPKERKKSIIQILKEQSLDIIRDLVNSTVNSEEQYIRFKFKSNYSGNPSPEYIYDIIHLLIHRNNEWTDKELSEIRIFVSNLKSFKGYSKDFINNILYNSEVKYYEKNTSIYTKNESKYYFILVGTAVLRYVNTKDIFSKSLLSPKGSNSLSPKVETTYSNQLLGAPKLYGNGYYQRRKSFLDSNWDERKINKAMDLCRRGSHVNNNTTKNEIIQIRNIGESFNNFEKDENDYELDSVLTSTSAYILEIDKNEYEKFKKLIEEQDIKEKTKFLKTLFFFNNFSCDSLYSYAEIINYRTIPIGQTIIKFGQPLEEFYIVKRGKCNVYRRLFLERDGEEKVFKIFVGQYGPGDYFGERGIIEYHGFLNIKNIDLFSKFSKPIQDKVPIYSELTVVAAESKHEVSIYDTNENKQDIKKIESEILFNSKTTNIEEKKAQQRKLRESKTIELAVITLNKARIKFKNFIEYNKFEKLSQDDLYCLFLESNQDKKWNKLKRQFNNDRLREIYCDPNINETKLDEMNGKERWKI
ncbi:hypothetical protein BCR36DRAFT_345618 [Piromyces finnis]|uniref:Cyclic nucleotide-binding domain-containing protein n=1 Tax=Piromyces finnis TaxID=1754191 RepID=A0A1Y1VHQ9_9FUNG|nr:hypothetical protein BCR36DRAFT_345618 [Piromyces finnis]|eukprot:ORX56494.1 hypothetical protein BCR36DRAFT_345618 [Piromyces finnis]